MDADKGLVKKRKKRRLTACIIFSVFLGVIVWLIYGNISIQSTVYEIVLPEEYAGLDGITIVQVSDLHNAEFGREQSRLIQAITNQSPDYIFVTGDLVDSNRLDIDTAMEFIEAAVEIAPVYYVTGNHEGWIGNSYNELDARLETSGVHRMSNCAETMLYNNTLFSVAGVYDPDMRGNNVIKTQDVIITLTESLDGYVILLSHRPELYDTYVESGVDLVFTGHAHGGQIRIPFLGGVVAPDQGILPEYTEGTFRDNNTTMVVSRGLGNSVIPVRINNRPELVVVKLYYPRQ